VRWRPMSGELKVTVSDIRKAGSELQRVADQLDSQIGSFEGAISGFGEPWGGDDLGMLIGLAHGAVFDAAMECFDNNLSEIEGIAKALGVMADNFESAEQGATEKVESVGKSIAG
jgi:hypothetical protein